MKKISAALLFIFFIFGLISVQSLEDNGKELKKLIKELKFGYAFVPSKTIEMDGERVGVQSFFMLKTEVSNMDYKEYLFYLKNNATHDEYIAALPDTTQWIALGEEFKAIEGSYFKNWRFNHYPMVNVSQKQAEKYCEWLTGVLQDKTGNKTLRVRLPLRAEFLCATNNSIESPYAWEGNQLRNKKGQFLCNFVAIPETQLTKNSVSGALERVEIKSTENSTGEIATLTAPVDSYWPNEYGFFNLNGNVSEWIGEENVAMGGDWKSLGYDVRNDSRKVVHGAHPTVGFRPVVTYSGQ